MSSSARIWTAPSRLPLNGRLAPAIAYDLYEGAELIGVVAHELEVGLDVGAQHPWAGCLRFDARLHGGPRLLEHLADGLGDQVVFAGEVVTPLLMPAARTAVQTLSVRLRTPLDDPKAVLDALPEVEGWEQTPSGYTLNVSNPDLAAPALARALVAANADILSLAESHHSLEDVYLALIDEDGRPTVFGIFLAAAALFAIL